MGTTTSRVSRTLAVGGVLLVLVVTGACGGEDVGNAGPPEPPTATLSGPPGPPGPSATPTDEPGDGSPPGSDVFDEADEKMDQMVDSEAVWHAPAQARVDTSLEIGLSIGDGEELRQQVEQALPDSPTQPGIPLRVGTDVSARLLGDPKDVTVTPDDSIDASTGSDIALLWTWIVRPLRPVDQLRLTAYLSMTVPTTDHVITKIVRVTMRVARTFSYTVHQVFTNWATWVAVVGALTAAARWMGNRRRIREVLPRPGHRGAGRAPPEPDTKSVLKE